MILTNEVIDGKRDVELLELTWRIYRGVIGKLVRTKPLRQGNILAEEEVDSQFNGSTNPAVLSFFRANPLIV